MVAWRIKNKNLRYDYKLHCVSYIDDVRQLKQLHVLKTVKVHVLRLLKNICKCYALETNYSVLYIKF
jgi:hypothetical protein